MSYTSIFFNGRLIFRPGSYSEVDPTGLEAQGLGASGVVAIIGTAEGGVPVSALTKGSEIPRFSSLQRAQAAFRSGNLKEAAPMAFSPSSDPDIQAGAQSVYFCKVNPSTKASATFSNGSGASLEILSADYGEFANQISVSIGTGTTKGKLVTVSFEDKNESVDDIGGDAIFSLLYRPSTGEAGTGWTTMTADVLAGGVRANATQVLSGGDGAKLLSETGTFTASSSSASDTQTLYVVGVDSATPIVRSIALNGTNPVTVGAFSGGVFGAWLSSAAVGTVDIDETGTNLSIAPGGVSTAGVKGNGTFVQNGNAISFVADGATSAVLYLVGRNSSGSQVVEAVTLNGTTPVASAITNLVDVEFWTTGAIAAARTVTASAVAAQSVHTTQTTMIKTVDFFNAKQRPNAATPAEPFGFNAIILTGLTTLPSTNLDVTSASVNIDNPVTGSFFADLFFLVDALSNQFSLVTATKSSGAVGVPDNTTSPVFLTGGSEGTALFSDWQAAINLLKQVRVNTIVPLTSDPAVHAALKAHCEYMGGIGRSERDGIVGLKNSAQTGLPTKSEIKSQIVSLNTRHLRATAQSVDRFNTEGLRTTFDPHFLAVIGAGMQAGSTVGTPLTNKITNSLAVSQHSTWNPLDDAEEMIQAGLFFAEEVENIGRRWVRNVTTNVSSSNIAFTEASVNEAVNFAVFEFRTALEFAVGRAGFAGTINATKSIALNRLGLLTDQNVITAFRSLAIELALDVLDVSVEIAPVIPINFVRTVIHLVNNTQSA